MNEAETRAGHIDPALKAASWGGQSRRAQAEIADDVLVYRNTQLAVILDELKKSLLHQAFSDAL